MENGSLLLLSPSDQPVSLQRVWHSLHDPRLGCSQHEYAVYAYLRRFGYILGRYGCPWTDSSKRTNAHMQHTVGQQVEGASHAGLAGIPCSAVESGWEDTEGSSGVHTEQRVKEATVACRDTAGGSDSSSPAVRDSHTVCDDVCEEWRATCLSETMDAKFHTDSPPPLRGAPEGGSRCVPDKSVRDEDQGTPLVLPRERLRIAFSVFMPNARFKKSDPGSPDFLLAVCNDRYAAVNE